MLNRLLVAIFGTNACVESAARGAFTSNIHTETTGNGAALLLKTKHEG